MGVNWLPLNPEPTRCMLQALAKTPQAAVEAAVGSKMNWWWAQGTADSGPPVKADNHGTGDWTATASCWVRAPSFASGGGLGWSFVVLLLLSAAGYLSVGAVLARRGGRSGQRWPHEPFWRELRALVADGWAFTTARGRGRRRRQGQGDQSGGGGPGSEGRAEAERAGRGRKEKKGRKGGREKALRRSGRERGGASDAGAGAPLLPSESGPSAEPAAAAAAAPVADGTAAGDGGRWVRVPNG